MSHQLLYDLTIDPSKINNKNILITGGTGSFGQKMIGTLLRHFKPRRIIIYSRDEYKQSLMKETFCPKKYPNIRYFIGDVRDLDRLNFAFREVDLVFHTSALKRIQECEYNPMETIKTNILGTNNVISAAIKNDVKYVIGLSTDKACSPVNLYGATKLCGEKLLINGNILSGGKTKFAVVRYGNQFGSRGSLVEIFKRYKESNRSLTVTDLSMTRFTILLQEAVHFVLLCLDIMIGGEIFIPKLPSYSIEQMVNCFDHDYQTIGSRPGEKFHELMISTDESHMSYEFDHFFVITPLQEYNIQSFNVDSYHLPYKQCKSHAPYSSGDNVMISNERLTYLIDHH